MKTVKISRVQYYDCADMYNNIYTVSIRATYDGYYRTFSIKVAANTPEDAKAFMSGLLDKHIALVPDDKNDVEGFDNFCNTIAADVQSDKLQSKYFLTEEEEKERLNKKLRELGII